MRKLLLVVPVLVGLAVPAVAPAARRADGSRPAGRTLVKAVTRVKLRTFNAVGAGSVAYPYLRAVPRGHVARRPLVLAEGAAWCPHCVADSWPLAIAVARFGTFTRLGRVSSGTFYTPGDGSPAYHHTRGISFYGARYHSHWIRFADVTVGTNTGKALDTPTRREARIIERFSPDQSLPSVSLGGPFGQVGAHVPIVAQLQHQRFGDVETALKRPKSPLARTILGQANEDTAAICAATHQEPRAICKTSGVEAAGAFLPSS